MQIKLYTDYNNFNIYTVKANKIISCLNLLRLQIGDERIEAIINTPHYFIYQKEDTKVLLFEQTLNSTLEDGEIIIIPKLEAEDPFSIGAFLLTFVSVGIPAGSFAAVATTIGTVALMGASIGVQALISLLTPTNTFHGNAAEAQNKTSNLFNNTQLSGNDGGAVPLIYGTDVFCTGVPIGSAVTTDVMTY